MLRRKGSRRLDRASLCSLACWPTQSVIYYPFQIFVKILYPTGSNTPLLTENMAVVVFSKKGSRIAGSSDDDSRQLRCGRSVLLRPSWLFISLFHLQSFFFSLLLLLLLSYSSMWWGKHRATWSKGARGWSTPGPLIVLSHRCRWCIMSMPSIIFFLCFYSSVSLSSFGVYNPSERAVCWWHPAWMDWDTDGDGVVGLFMCRGFFFFTLQNEYRSRQLL